MHYYHTMICIIYSLHELKYFIDGSEKTIYFVVMKNFFNTDLDVSVRYDLKGSLYSRFVDP